MLCFAMDDGLGNACNKPPLILVSEVESVLEGRMAKSSWLGWIKSLV